MAVAAGQQANAFEFKTGDDWQIRWDNTVKYNLAFRTQDPDSDVTARSNGPLADDGDLNFGDQWSNISNRFDLLTQLDAFVFWNFNVGQVTGNIRAGRHTIFWGNSLLLSGAIHGVAGSMVAIDVAKGFAVPGSEAQELFLPTNKLSTVLQLTPNLTFNAYYSLEWRNYRLPETGSFFSPAEVLTDDSEFLMAAPGVPGVSPRVGQVKVDDEQPGDSGEWGVNLQYYFNGADLEASFFFLNYKDKLQQGITGAFDFGQFTVAQGSAGNAPFDQLLAQWTSLAAAGVVPPPTLPSAAASDAISVGQFKWAYKEDVRSLQ